MDSRIFMKEVKTIADLFRLFFIAQQDSALVGKQSCPFAFKHWQIFFKTLIAVFVEIHCFFFCDRLDRSLFFVLASCAGENDQDDQQIRHILFHNIFIIVSYPKRSKGTR